MSQDATLKTLHELIEACKDCEYAFNLYAQHTTTDSLREHYLARAGRCRRIAQELRIHLIGLGDRADLHGSTWGFMSRLKLRAKAALASTGHPQTWLLECSRTELTLLTKLRQAMKTGVLPEPVMSALQRHFHAWQHIHGQMRFLRGLGKAA
ncbi:MAG: PA2169 family four-helix-bundle protein [Acidobacteriota bacterium]